MDANDTPRLISYVVDHDTGFAPNPFFGKCILSHCKFSADGKRSNVIELADKGTWVVGTGGSRLQKHGKLIYAMKVEEKLPITQLFRLPEFAHRREAFGYRKGCGQNNAHHGKWMLVATKFYYFGANAIEIPDFLKHFENPDGKIESLEKRGPRHRSRFSDAFVKRFEDWIQSKKKGRNGLPHKLDAGTEQFLRDKNAL